MSPSGKGQDTSDLRAKWDKRYSDSNPYPPPAAVLSENLHLLPRRGRALDLACGLGANALRLAEHGLDVVAWDLSSVAVERLEREAAARGLRIETRVRDVCAFPPEPGGFDVVIVSHFLERDLAPTLMGALRPGGLIFYQTFSREAVTDCGPSNPDFRLAGNELLDLFRPLLVRFYREEGWAGDPTLGTRDVAQLVAQKPLCRS